MQERIFATIGVYVRCSCKTMTHVIISKHLTKTLSNWQAFQKLRLCNDVLCFGQLDCFCNGQDDVRVGSISRQMARPVPGGIALLGVHCPCALTDPPALGSEYAYAYVQN